MAIALRWVGPEELDRVALARLRCYAHADKELERFKDRMHTDGWAHCANYLLAEMNGEAVGTATSLAFKMSVRGAVLPCQGVAWVGSVKTMRRRGGDSSKGIASVVMREMIRQAREREDPITALTPFRASFYEHFGYGLVERRFEWIVPITVLPSGSFEGIRFYEPRDSAARTEALLQINRAGQCDIERPAQVWNALDEQLADGFQVVDRPDNNGPVKSWMFLVQQMIDGQNTLVVADHFQIDTAALRRQLHFLSSLRDQYSAVLITLPADLPLNRLLKESQLPHRPVNHPVTKYKAITRLQLRILDHARFLQALNLPISANGRTTVAVHECEGETKKFSVDITSGKAVVRPSDSTADFECADRIWAAVACGDLPASQALRLELASGNAKSAALLDALSEGPTPFCHEYF